MDEMKKIVMIGPVYPYKGGIAHYTALMYRALSKKYSVTLFSFKKQYPKFLFRKKQVDYSNDSFKIENTFYELTSYNPISCIRLALKIKKINPDLVIFQWWHPYFSPCFWIIKNLLGKQIKTLFLCHNVFPHERFPLDRLLTKIAIRSADFYITQSKMDTADLLSIKPFAKYYQTVLPTFNIFKLNDITYEAARKILDIKDDEKVILFFGFVRRYKGLQYLIKAMPRILKKLNNIKLLIVGDFDNDKDEYLQLIDDYNIQQSVCIYEGYIPDNDVEKFFSASDLIVLPYESATQSGIVQIAFGFGKPVIVTNVGGLPEAVADGITGYVVEPKNPDALANSVIKFFNEDKAVEFGANIMEEEDKFSWDRMVETIERLWYE